MEDRDDENVRLLKIDVEATNRLWLRVRPSLVKGREHNPRNLAGVHEEREDRIDAEPFDRARIQLSEYSRCSVAAGRSIA